MIAVNMAAGVELNEKDWKDLCKFNRHLIFKTIQIIIQSRTGQAVTTQSKLIASGSDWFNLSVRDDTAVLGRIKNVYSKFGPDGLRPGSDPLCINITLCPKILSEEKVPLETWWIQMSNVRDKSVRVSFGVYNRMSVLLKCLFMISRAAPAYRTCRDFMRDGSEVIYSIHIGKPQLQLLGDNVIKCLVGSVPTPVGTVEIFMGYRANVAFLKKINLEKLITDNITEDHFACPQSDDSDLGKDYVHVNRAEISFDLESEENKNKISNSTPAEEANDADQPNNITDDKVDQLIVDKSLFGAPDASNSKTPSCSSREKSGRDEQDQSYDKELREFYRDSLAAPSLHMFTQSPADDLVLENLSFALAEFEANAQKFDDFFKSIDNLDLN